MNDEVPCSYELLFYHHLPLYYKMIQNFSLTQINVLLFPIIVLFSLPNKRSQFWETTYHLYNSDQRVMLRLRKTLNPCVFSQARMMFRTCWVQRWKNYGEKHCHFPGSLFENNFMNKKRANQSIVSSSQGMSLQEWLERPVSKPRDQADGRKNVP